MVHRLVTGAFAVATLASCSSGSGQVASWPPGAVARATTGADGTVRSVLPPQSSSKMGAHGGETTSGVLPQQSAPSTGAPDGSAGPKWVISMPDSIAGYPRVVPRSPELQQLDASVQTDMRQLGITGQIVRGVYDDARDDYYLVVYGVNGAGFNTATLQNIKSIPVADLMPSGTTVEYPRVDPGPHGGDDLCIYMSMVQSVDGVLGHVTSVTENTDCDWMTTTTVGSMFFLTKGDLKFSGVSGQVTPSVAGPALLAVRDAVEHRQG